jgi:hypothetical protein
MVPAHAKVDDVVVILYGGAVPFVVRDADGRNWRIVGSSMFGEFIAGETAGNKSELCDRDSRRNICILSCCGGARIAGFGLALAR